MVHVFSLSTFAWLVSFSTGGSWSKFILVSPDEKTAYVSNWESGDVSVIDTGSRSATARISVGAGRFADGGARCDEREVVVCCSQTRPGAERPR